MEDNNKSLPRETVEEFVWRFGEAEFDEAKWELRNRGEPVELEPRPLEILSILLRHAGEVVTKDELLEAVWPGVIVVDKALTNAIGKLRKALDDENQQLIETVHRVGYRLVAPVTRRLVSRRLLPKLDLKPGEPVPRREQWKLLRSLDVSVRSEVWLAEHEKTREKRVFKFSPDGARLSALKREATLSRVLTDTLGERQDFIRVLEWNFAEAPYFIECEYGGENWLQWAEAQGGLHTVPLEQRLALFVQAADAVAAAHGAGVLHKDLKPANLLIQPRGTGADAGWQVRVTDFGSGRLAEPGRLAELGITQMGFTQTQSLAADSLTGTLMYLAPEVLAGQPATQASDVFALGVLLYQIVVGDFKRAITPGWEREVEDELLRGDIGAAAAGDLQQRLASSSELTNRIGRLAARRTERAERETLELQAAALRSAAEKNRARRPWLVAVLATLIIGFSVSLYLLVRTEQAQRETKQEAEIADAINGFFNDQVLAEANPYKGGDGKVTVLDALAKAIGKVDTSFPAQPLIAARLHYTAGVVYLGRRDLQLAQVQFQRAYDLYQAALGPSARITLQAGIRLAATLSAIESDGNPGRDLLTKIDLLAAPLLASDYELDSDLKRAWSQLLADHESDFAGAARYAEMALASERKLAHPRRDVLDAGDYNLAYYDMSLGRYTEAEAVLHRSIDELKATKGWTHPDTLDVRFMLVRVLNEQSRYTEAKNLGQSVYEDRLKVLGPTNINVADALIAVGDAQSGTGEWSSAVTSYSKVLYEYYPPFLDPGVTIETDTESSVMGLRAKLANVQARQGKAEQVLPTFADLLAKARKEYADSPPFIELCAYNYASALIDAGHVDAAVPLLDEVDPAVVVKYALRTDWVGRVAFQRGRIALAHGDKAAAAALLTQAVAVMREQQPAGYWMRDAAEAELKRAESKS